MMLRIYTSSASRDAKGYFDNELSKGDYYSEYQQVAGQWGGLAAGMLGLVGDVDKEGFHALCDNLHPVTGKRLGVRHKANRRVGYDISFHVPKSVSLVFEHSRDEAIIDAFRQAVSETMSEMEKDVRTQSWLNLKKVKPVTGNMVWAEFIHLTSRPVDGGVPDPHLHAHCFTFNTTYDSKEKRWKAGEFVRFYHDSLYYRTAFHARLAKGLKNLGYGINRTENAFEIAEVPASLIEKFSKRTTLINNRAKELGITDPELKDRLGAYTRDRKNLQYSKEELQTEWEKQFSPEELLAIQAVVAGKNGGNGGGKDNGQITAKTAMDHALLHGLERASVSDHKRLLAEALHYGMGDLDVDDVIFEGRRSEILSREIEGNLLSTTKEVLAEEKAMTHFARSTLNTKHQMVSDKEQILDTKLNEEQIAGIKNIWFSYNQVMGIIGGAGVGKTRLMTEAIRGIEAHGHKVFTFAPSASASRDTLQSEGFTAADTVARLLIDEQLQQQLQNQVIWIDEAGLLGVRDMNKVFKIAMQYNCRVILSGDSKQHAPVPRGDALRILETHAGIKFPEIRKIQRQKSETYRDAVYALSQGNVDKAFDKLESINAIIEYKDGEERNSVLAEEYLSSIQAGEKTLIISPSHAEGEAVTESVRNLLRQNYLLGESRVFSCLENTQWTEAQKADPKNYAAGMVIEFHENADDVESTAIDGEADNTDADADYHFMKKEDGFELFFKSDSKLVFGEHGSVASFRKKKSRGRTRINKGDKLRILGYDKNGNIKGVNDSGDILHLPAAMSSRFQVYRSRRMQIAVNEKLLLTKNSRIQNNQKVNNGDLVRVKSFTNTGDLKLSNGKTISKDHGHLKYGYCTTSYASQGKTVDKILLAQSSKSKRASSKEQFYVSISRGKKMIKIFTDSKDALRNMVKSSSSRTSAQDIIKTPTIREKIADRAYTVARLASRTRAYASTAITYAGDAARVVANKAKVTGSAAKTVTFAAAGKAKTWAEKVGARSPRLILPENFKPQQPPGGPNGPRTI